MTEKLAKIFSLLFHPMLLPSFAVVILFIFPSYLSHYPYTYKKGVVLVVFLSTFISPLLIMLILLNLKVISDLFLKERKERFYPLIIASVIYLTAYFILLNLPLGIPTTITNFVLISAGVILSVLIINIKIKASAHMAGIGGLIAFFFIFFLKENIGEILISVYSIKFTALHFFSFLILVAGLVATSRLILKAHTIKEISLGFLIGIFIGSLNVFLV